MWEIETNLKWSNLTKEEKMKHGIIQARKERLERSKRCCRNMPPMFVGSVVATSIVISWLFFFTFSLALAWNRWGMYKSKIKKRKEEKRGSRIWKALVDLDFRFSIPSFLSIQTSFNCHRHVLSSILKTL